eukprot:CAMPEP_0185731118 /NCGR_PEP_ID=MMETSP1171-20130828/11925_1 /TAXON_ID=374046 /ORGANISM="Helicotheca tamensis, Strain CCMP826" /LENGTH=178 /DNA_ID=CAMNT_0028400309 /DNA_START=34 /DNA_END=569 /DNA_ORIENTATION=+
MPMKSATSIAISDAPSTPSSVSYECHSILLCDELLKTSLSDEVYDNEEDSEDGSCGSDYDENESSQEDLDLDRKTFQQLAKEREVQAVIHGFNLLSSDLDCDDEDEDDEVTQKDHCEGKVDACRDGRSSAVDSNEHAFNTKSKVLCIEAFERRAVKEDDEHGEDNRGQRTRLIRIPPL